MYQDGVEVTVLPDCARCIIEDKHPLLEMDKCPLWKCDSEYECSSDCEYYTEQWGREKKDGEQE